uniref:Uncharacterized protein n=2 Tax=Oryza sativa subsp. japonica TaxID=39947 RepID=Q8S6T4_ORYSJ|nr:Hypothetical protein [Oryza sativa Japonica Group]AAP52770.1 hypothetical protein LOC_Os10g14270 [Oryza sativa Japonica Group]AAX95209.1 hypothetical protein LOC_Os11g08780 [Oryza sativa Japonica Group]ABA91897.1 hypothetical protein LOC_Os11g08780 [Oryza sativa Japonica Group]BAC57296.1 hypothetical protein [Oryza sativa Japonica Group]
MAAERSRRRWRGGRRRGRGDGGDGGGDGLRRWWCRPASGRSTERVSGREVGGFGGGEGGGGEVEAAVERRA